MNHHSSSASFSEGESPKEEKEIIHDGLLLAAPGVLKVHYGGNKSTLFSFNEDTTADDAVCAVCEQLDCGDSKLYSLVLIPKNLSFSKTEKRRAKISSDDVLLPSWDALAKIVNDRSVQHHECHLKITFISKDIHKMSLEDPHSLGYFFRQCVNDVLADTKYSSGLCTEDILKLASLQMLETSFAHSDGAWLTTNDNHQKKTTDKENKFLVDGETLLKRIEDDYGLEHFLPQSVIEDLQSNHAQESRQVLQQHVKTNYMIYFGGTGSSNTTPSGKHSCGNKEDLLLQLQTEYIKLFLSLTSYGDWYFDANILTTMESNVTLVVGCQRGISQITENHPKITSIFPDFSLIQSIEVAPCSSESFKTQVKIDVKEDAPLLVTMKPRYAFNFACLVDGCCRVHNNDDGMLIMPMATPIVDYVVPHMERKSITNNYLSNGDSFSQFSDAVGFSLLSDPISKSGRTTHQGSSNENEKDTAEVSTDAKNKISKSIPSASGTPDASFEDSLPESVSTSSRSSLSSSEAVGIEYLSSISQKTKHLANSKQSRREERSDHEHESDCSEAPAFSSVGDKTSSKGFEAREKKRNPVKGETDKHEESDQIAVKNPQGDDKESYNESVSDTESTTEDVRKEKSDADHITSDQCGKELEDDANIQLATKNIIATSRSVTDIEAAGDEFPKNGKKKSKDRFSWFAGGTLQRSKTLDERSSNSRDAGRRSFFRNFFSPKRSYSVGKEMEYVSTDATSSMPRSESGFGRKWKFPNFFKSSSPPPSKTKSRLSFLGTLSRKKREHTLYDSDSEEQSASKSFSGFYSLFKGKKLDESGSAASRKEVEESSSGEGLNLKTYEKPQADSVLHDSQNHSDTQEQGTEDEPAISSKSTPRSSVSGSVAVSQTTEDEQGNIDSNDLTLSLPLKINSKSSLASEESPDETKHSPRGTPPAKPPRLYYQLSSSPTTSELNVDSKDENDVKNEEIIDVDQTLTQTIEDDTESTTSEKEINQKDTEMKSAENKNTSENHEAETDEMVNKEIDENISENAMTHTDEEIDVSDNEEEGFVKIKIDVEIAKEDDKNEIGEEVCITKNSVTVYKESVEFEEERQISEDSFTTKQGVVDKAASTLEERKELDGFSTIEDEAEPLDKTDTHEQIREVAAIESKNSLDENTPTNLDNSIEVSLDSDAVAESVQVPSQAKEENYEFHEDVLVTNKLSDSFINDRKDNEFEDGRTSSIERLEQHDAATNESTSVSDVILNSSNNSDSSGTEARPDQEFSLTTEKLNVSSHNIHMEEKQVLSEREANSTSVESQSSTSEDIPEPKHTVSPKPPISPKPTFLPKISFLKTASKVPSLDNDETERSLVKHRASPTLTQENPEPVAAVLNRLLTNGLNSNETSEGNDHLSKQKTQDTDNKSIKLDLLLLQKDDQSRKENFSQKREIDNGKYSMAESSTIDKSGGKWKNQIDENHSRHVSKETTNLENSSKSVFLSGSSNLFPHQPTIADASEPKFSDVSNDTEAEIFDFPPPPEEFNIFPREIIIPKSNSNSNQALPNIQHENDEKPPVKDDFKPSQSNVGSKFDKETSPKVFKGFTPIRYQPPKLPLSNQPGPDMLSSNNQPSQTYHSLIAPRLFGQQREMKSFSKIKPPTPATKKIQPSGASA